MYICCNWLILSLEVADVDEGIFLQTSLTRYARSPTYGYKTFLYAIIILFIITLPIFYHRFFFHD